MAGPHAVRADAFDVDIADYSFTPANLTVHVGEPVTWTNQAGRNHTVTSDDGSELDSGDIGPGEAYGHVFEAAGTYKYHCSIHPDRMQGTVTVVAATPAPSTNATPEPTPPTGTLPPNFSPFPSLGPIETTPSSPPPADPDRDGAPRHRRAVATRVRPLLIVIGLVLLLVGRCDVVLLDRDADRHPPSGRRRRRPDPGEIRSGPRRSAGALHLCAAARGAAAQFVMLIGRLFSSGTPSRCCRR